jgi:hypothetical protein
MTSRYLLGLFDFRYPFDVSKAEQTHLRAPAILVVSEFLFMQSIKSPRYSLRLMH